MKTLPRSSASASAVVMHESMLPSWKTTSAPYDRVASTLGSGAPSGMTTVALVPSACAANATPCA